MLSVINKPIMLSVIMLSVVMLSVFMLNVVMLSLVAPLTHPNLVHKVSPGTNALAYWSTVSETKEKVL